MAIKQIKIAIQREKLSEKVVPVKFCKRVNLRASFLQSINAFILMVALTVLENKRVEIVSTWLRDVISAACEKALPSQRAVKAAISEVGTTTSIAYCLKLKISSNIFMVHSYSKFLNEDIDMIINFIRYLCEFLSKKTQKQIQYFFQHWDSRGIFLWKKSIKLFKRVELEV